VEIAHFKNYNSFNEHSLRYAFVQVDTQAYSWTIDFFPCPESRKFEALGLPGGGEFDPVLG